MFPIEKSPKISAKFVCEKCNYKCNKNSEYNKHILTAKHKILQNPTLDVNNKMYTCECGKIYKHSSTLYAHKKKCKYYEEENYIITEEKNNTEDLINYLMKENSEFKQLLLDQNKQMIELAKVGGNYNINNNSHNKTFNLNMFLNETCKNAMNITEFVDSLQLQMSDLENVGEAGYIEGISSIIIKKLNTLDVTERPIHCTDKKRETMYIKDQDKWEKEDEKKTKMHKLVTKVANKNINMISEFQKLHPEWKKCSSKYADQHNKIVIESMGGKGDNEYEKQEKIIKKIAKEVFVDKNL
jgi:Txe/YoeB family toxin of Txe-Axe toxin-antitoxin module